MLFHVNKWSMLNKPLKKNLCLEQRLKQIKSFQKTNYFPVLFGFFVCFVNSTLHLTTILEQQNWCLPKFPGQAQGLGRGRDRPAKSWHSAGGHRRAGATTDFCCQNLEEFISGWWRHILILWWWQSQWKKENQHNKYCTEGNMPVVKGYE